MPVKKRRRSLSGAVYIIISILIILSLLFILFKLYKQLNQNRDGKRKSVIVESIPKNESEAFKELEKLRNNKDFSWPLTKDGFSGLFLTEHKAFYLGYSEDHEQAAWVSYLLSREHSVNAHDRRNNFRKDPGIPSESASPGDYTRSGYDRGHLAPAADFDYDKKVLSETFYMSNISPQKPGLNRGRWKELEEQVRSWATEYDSLWVVSGPVLENGLKKIGKNRVSIPKYFYKIILDPKQPNVKIIGFLMPNSSVGNELIHFAVPVDSIEKMCRLDFFPQLPDLLEDSLENYVLYEAWFDSKHKK